MDANWIPPDPWEIAIWLQDEPWEDGAMPDFGPDVDVWIQCASLEDAEYVRDLIDKNEVDKDGSYIFTGIRPSIEDLQVIIKAQNDT